MASNDSGNSVMVSFNDEFLLFASSNKKAMNSCCLSVPDVFDRRGTNLQMRYTMKENMVFKNIVVLDTCISASIPVYY